MIIYLDECIDLIRYEHPYAWAWEFDDLCQWVAWFNKNHFLLNVTRDGNTICGLMMVRPVMYAPIGNSLEYDQEGPMLYVDFAYAPTREVMRALVVLAIQRFGQRKWVAWDRHGLLRVYFAARFVRHILKEKENVTT